MKSACKPRALVIGVTGQDGALLASHLLKLGYEVIGTSRDAEQCNMESLNRLGLVDQVTLKSLAPADFRSVVRSVLHILPDEIYNLSGQSSVGLSFEQPVETLDSHLTATVNILEAIRMSERPIRFYNACSTECFGNVVRGTVNEESPFHPRSPYATAKASSYWMVSNYREAYGMFACSGILSNHESELRSTRFVTQKIVRGAVAIQRGVLESLTLGNLSVCRDWGWAAEYVVAMQRMLQMDAAEDFVVATGETHSLREFVEIAFTCVGLNAAEHIRNSDRFHRPSELNAVYLDPSRARDRLGWSASIRMNEVVARMVRAEQQRVESVACV
jgi:GDPmannose 4,6-dehydratase